MSRARIGIVTGNLTSDTVPKFWVPVKSLAIIKFLVGSATEKARLPKLSFVLGTISCCEIDDLSCLGIFERCRRLAK